MTFVRWCSIAGFASILGLGCLPRYGTPTHRDDRPRCFLPEGCDRGGVR